MVVVTLPRADALATALDDWWRAHRSAAPNLFLDECRDALARLAETPEAGPLVAWGSARARRRRVLLLHRSGHHVYYRYFPRKKLVAVEAVWPAVRGRRPPLGSP